MSKNIDLTTGNISQKIFRFTMPLLGSSFIGMTYTFVDMICIGALGSGSVAAVGSAGFFMWFANASSAMARIGTQVLTSQAYGCKKYDDVKKIFRGCHLDQYSFRLDRCGFFDRFQQSVDRIL